MAYKTLVEAKDTVMKPEDLCILVCQNYRLRTLEAKDCQGLNCDECQLEAQAEISFLKGGQTVVDWIQRNAIYSHEPSYEHIRLGREEWNSLIKGIVPKERTHIVFKKLDEA